MSTEVTLASRQARDEAKRERQELDGSVIDVQVFVIEESHDLEVVAGAGSVARREKDESGLNGGRIGASTSTPDEDGDRETGDGRRETGE
ncbi:hypothetical protein [Sorangium sp. So ce176]|uniref:hypothetical protein n=1 Tax=Sorangium sp. So ce176 TaxID=3133286 RepID=UPI003F648E6A